MKCDRCRREFTDYLEGNLSASRREQVAAHLRQCPDCTEELEAFRRTVAALRGLEVVAPPSDLLPRIRQAIAAQPQPARPWFRLSWQHLGAAATAAALVVGFVAVFSYQRIGPVSERFSEQPAGTVLQGLERAAPAQEKLVSPAEVEKEEAEVEAPSVAAPKSVPAKTPSKTKQAPRETVHAGADARREQLPPSTLLALESAQPKPPPLAAGAPKRVAVPENEASGEAAAAPGGASGLAGMAGEKPEVLGVGPYRGAGTLPDMASVEAGTKVVITPPPLTERIVGKPVPVRVTIQPQANVEKAVVQVQPLGGLELADAQPVIYHGPLLADKPKQLSFTIIARETGTQQCQVEVSSELPGVAASTTVAIPGFEPPPKHITTQVFKDTPLDEAIRIVAHEADMNVAVGEGLEQRIVTCDFSVGVPGEAALRVLAELGGCQLEVEDGTYRIYCPADDDGQ